MNASSAAGINPAEVGRRQGQASKIGYTYSRAIGNGALEIKVRMSLSL